MRALAGNRTADAGAGVAAFVGGRQVPLAHVARVVGQGDRIRSPVVRAIGAQAQATWAATFPEDGGEGVPRDEITRLTAETMGKTRGIRTGDNAPVRVAAQEPRRENLARQRRFTVARRDRDDQPRDLAALDGFERPGDPGVKRLRDKATVDVVAEVDQPPPGELTPRQFPFRRAPRVPVIRSRSAHSCPPFRPRPPPRRVVAPRALRSGSPASPAARASRAWS